MFCIHSDLAEPTPKSIDRLQPRIQHYQPLKTIFCYMPIIQEHAHDIAILNTVVKRVISIAFSVKQKKAVLTVDEALVIPKLMELKWTTPHYKGTLISRLGGLHAAMNFLKVLGQHTKDFGLSEIWTKREILGPNTADKAMAGTSYAKGMRAHELSLQALWQLVLPQHLVYLEEKVQQLKDFIAGTMEKDRNTSMSWGL